MKKIKATLLSKNHLNRTIVRLVHQVIESESDEMRCDIILCDENDY